MVESFDGSARERRGSMAERRGSMAERRGSVELFRASVEERRGSVEELRRSVALLRASVEERRKAPSPDVRGPKPGSRRGNVASVVRAGRRLCGVGGSWVADVGAAAPTLPLECKCTARKGLHAPLQPEQKHFAQFRFPDFTASANSPT